MDEATWIKDRNAELKGDLPDCSCGYKPKDYMDFVKHRDTIHHIAPGFPDVMGAKPPKWWEIAMAKAKKRDARG